MQPSYALTLELSKEDRNYDDKADILELNELAESTEHILRADRAPDAGLLPVLRLLNLSGTRRPTGAGVGLHEGPYRECLDTLPRQESHGRHSRCKVRAW